MPRPPSDATVRALELVRDGAAPYAAAKECGIASNTIYRALARVREGQKAMPAHQAVAERKVKSAGAGKTLVPSRRARRTRRSPG